MATRIVTQQDVKSQLHYDIDSGIFTRKIATANCIKVGEIAGTKGRYGYILISINGKQHAAHRLAWLYAYGYTPKGQLDHINGVRTDNRISNLREASALENMRNKKLHENNKSGYKGVSWDKSKGKWRAASYVNGKQFHLGRFDTAYEAHLAYTEFANKTFGEFVRTESEGL